MAGLIPYHWKNSGLARADAGFGDFYNMLDDFFSDSWLPRRSLLRDTFKIDIEESDTGYRLEAELPGVKKEEIDLGIDSDTLIISINRTEETNKDEKNYIHRERRTSSMSRRVRLAFANMDEISAKLDGGLLTITVPKDEKAATPRKIEIQ